MVKTALLGSSKLLLVKPSMRVIYMQLQYALLSSALLRVYYSSSFNRFLPRQGIDISAGGIVRGVELGGDGYCCCCWWRRVIIWEECFLWSRRLSLGCEEEWIWGVRGVWHRRERGRGVEGGSWGAGAG